LVGWARLFINAFSISSIGERQGSRSYSDARLAYAGFAHHPHKAEVKEDQVKVCAA
jgi:hypothetical protein